MSKVEWKTIGDICEIIRGNGVQKTDFVENGLGCIHYGQIYTHYGAYTYSTKTFVSQETFEKAKKASKGDIIMTDTSENVEDICKSVAYLGEDDIAISNHTLILKHKQNPKFLSYSTQTNSFFNQKRKYVVGVKVSGIKPEQLAKIKIYLPSLSEQNKIVDILDTFTSSIENLKEQIAQRRKQYEYYRDQLLDLEGKDGANNIKLENIVSQDCSLSYGIVQPGDDVFEGVPVVRPVDLITTFVNRKGLKNTTKQISDSYKRTILKGNEILFCVRGTTGVMSLATQSLVGCNVTRGIVPISFDNEITKMFVYYQLKSRKLQKVIADKTNGTALKQINVKDLRQINLIIPSLSEQQRIVGILDVFEASIQNLEAQLAGREKQYEYYRNKLLTFE